MPKAKPIEKPQINPKLLYGEIVSWKFRETITPFKGKYCFRYELTFENGETLSSQKGGFKTKAEANKAKEVAIGQLQERNFVPFEVTVKEFYDYWLYYYMLDEVKITYNTYMSYRAIIYNYFIPTLGGERKITKITRNDIVKAMECFGTFGYFRKASGVMLGSFGFAKSKSLIYGDYSSGAIKAAQKKLLTKLEDKAPTNKIEDEPYDARTRILNVEQVAFLLYMAKLHTPEIFMALLFTITCGLRISEAFAVRFSDIDFGKKTLYMTYQIGRPVDLNLAEDQDCVCGSTLPPKSSNGIREIPLADFVIDEIVLAKQRYDQKKVDNPMFKDKGYISCIKTGNPFLPTRAYPLYQKLFRLCKFPYVKWHGLRHTYSTLLSEYGINMKAVSVCMGHYSEEFTREVYVAPKEVVYDATVEIQSFIDDVLPTQNPSQEIIDGNIDIREYLG